ncbi:MAG: hypothetical protein GY866_40360 [Proteobacteria bacterium]|nr:hypothetical protein [Pseudomonadota bacterium]
MFVITDKAAEQFQASTGTIGNGSLPLRISANKSASQGIVYNMGFDEPRKDDVSCRINGIDVIVDPASVDNVRTMVVDFRDFEGAEQFVFINPNDTEENCDTSPSGCDPDGNPSCRTCLGE